MSQAAAGNMPRPMSTGTLALTTLVLGLGSFMNILDLSIANVSVPSISGDLAVGYTQGTWVITSYAVSEAIMLPMTGWLAQRFGQVRMFVMATLLFTLASLLCGMAPSFEALVAARVLQGMVGASMIPLSQTSADDDLPAAKAWAGVGLVVDDHGVSARGGAVDGRLADGKSELALGIPHQFAGGDYGGDAGEHSGEGLRKPAP